jgi:CDP-glucose 4,6-dehydratase
VSFWAQRSIFITGCSGFLGSWLTVELLRRGAKVVGLMRNPARRHPSLSEFSVDRFVPVQGSIGDYPVIERALSDHGIDTVFHLASQSIVGLANKSPSATFETNIKGTWTLVALLPWSGADHQDRRKSVHRTRRRVDLCP